MNPFVHYDACPVCGSASINPLLTVKDHSVSGENFVIWQCDACKLRFTQDAPNETEIARYYKSENYISHTNTGNSLVNQVYLAVRKFTLKQKAATLKKYTTLSSGSLLDVGAGTGAFLKHMQEEGWEVAGTEPDADARNRAKQLSLDLHPAEALQSLPPGTFDAITLWHVLEHVHPLQAYMGILKSLLKPSGTLFIAVPNYQAYDAQVYKSAWAAYDVPRHLYHFSPQSMQVLTQRHRLKMVAQVPMWFDAFYISLLSSKYKNGKTAWMGALSSGLFSNMNALLHKEKCSSILYVISA